MVCACMNTMKCVCVCVQSATFFSGHYMPGKRKMQPKLEELKEDWLNKIVAERVPELKSKYTKKSGRTLFSNCVFSKEKRIYSEDSAIFIPLKREHICTGCLRYVGTFTQDRTLKLEERIYFRCI